MSWFPAGQPYNMYIAANYNANWAWLSQGQVKIQNLHLIKFEKIEFEFEVKIIIVTCVYNIYIIRTYSCMGYIYI